MAIGAELASDAVAAALSQVVLDRAALAAMPQHTARLPIACVEGWSTVQTWSGRPAGRPGRARRCAIAALSAGAHRCRRSRTSESGFSHTVLLARSGA